MEKNDKKLNSNGKAICYLICGSLFVSLLFPCVGYTQSTGIPAGKIFEQIKPSLLQIRVKLNTSGSITAYGSGFFVSSAGLVATNYHVVSSIVMEPETYSLEYLKSDGTTAPLQIMAIDVRNDLAILQLKHDKTPFLLLQKTKLHKGDRCYSLGNPLDIGMSIVEGTYNGSIATQYNELFHFTGAINPGMSGGPVVTENGVAFGVNKAIRLDGQMVGYVVPAYYVSALLEKVDKSQPKRDTELLANVNEQLLAYQDEITKRLIATPFSTITIGRGYRVPDKLENFFDCGGYKLDTTERYFTVNSAFCKTNSPLSVSEELNSGYITFTQDLVQSDRMREMNFASAYSRLFEKFGSISDSGSPTDKNVGRYACKEDMVTSGNMKMQVVLCERQYKKLDDLYDIQIKIATLNEPKAGLLSTAIFHGFSHENGIGLARRYLESLTWKP